MQATANEVLLRRWRMVETRLEYAIRVMSWTLDLLIYVLDIRLSFTSSPSFSQERRTSTRYFYGNIFWNCSPWPIHFRAPFSGPHSHLKWFISCSRFLNSPFFPGIKLPLESMIFAGLEMVVQILQSVWYNHSPARQKNQRWIDMCFILYVIVTRLFKIYYFIFQIIWDCFFGIPSLVDTYHRQINNFINFTIQCNGTVQPPDPN